MEKNTDLRTVAGGGLLDRRVFLKKGFAFSVATLAAKSSHATIENYRQSWMEKPGEPFSNYGQPSVHEKETIRWTMGSVPQAHKKAA